MQHLILGFKMFTLKSLVHDYKDPEVSVLQANAKLG